MIAKWRRDGLSEKDGQFGLVWGVRRREGDLLVFLYSLDSNSTVYGVGLTHELTVFECGKEIDFDRSLWGQDLDLSEEATAGVQYRATSPENAIDQADKAVMALAAGHIPHFLTKYWLPYFQSAVDIGSEFIDADEALLRARIERPAFGGGPRKPGATWARLVRSAARVATVALASVTLTVGCFYEAALRQPTAVSDVVYSIAQQSTFSRELILDGRVVKLDLIGPFRGRYAVVGGNSPEFMEAARAEGLF